MEAALAVLDYGVRALRLRNIAATTFTANVASLKIIRKLGFITALEGEHHGRRTVRYDQQRSPNNTLQRTRQKRTLGCD
jgi:RimJ/RimL family protein N-acetyltransferase